MKYWLVKSEPSAYSWRDFEKDEGTYWDGVRNYQARNNLAAMAKGDRVLFYHSVSEKAVVGIAEVVRESYQDPSSNDERWLAVDLKPVSALANPVTLAQIKAEAGLEGMALLRQSRLSVAPLSAAEFKTIVRLGSPRR